jgi:Ca2+-binding RTX toxin-like protein
VIAPIDTAEADFVDGREGADTMNAGDGDDIYIVDNAGDFVTEPENDPFGGVDEIRSTVSYSINFANKGDSGFGIENITLLGFANINATGNSNNNVLVGNGGNNILDGLGGDDTFIGGSGSDRYDGGEGHDTIDYSSLGQRVTLKSQGIIEKPDGFGTDTIAGLERIIGTLGQSNVIDGTVGGPQATSFNINLDTNNLTVNGIPGIGSSSFFVQNFTDVRGTSNNDTVVGNGAGNVFFGTAGNDSYDGGPGGFDTNDTIDYSALGTAVTLKSQGIIEKGALGTDTIARMERIIGALGQSNVIDGTVGGQQATSFKIDLATSNLTVNGIPGIGSSSFFVQNFTNVRGTSNNDTVVGDGAGNVFFGTAGNDSYDGLDGFDTIDYGALGTAVTLKSQGIIEKGALGTDTIARMERIIGAAGQTNVIDGFTGGPQPTSFEIDLEGSFLLVKNIPRIGDQAFFIKDFVNVRGTTNHDFITGNALANRLDGDGGNDTLIGGAGNDTVIGGAGNDSYGFDADLALGADRLNEAGGGIDTLDFSATTNRSIALRLDLATSQVVNPNLSLSLGSGIVFENVIGGGLADTLTGNTLDNRLDGGGGNDALIGDAGNDTLIGGAGDDSYSFDADLALGADMLNEAGGGIDTLDFSATTSRSIALRLDLATSQVVNPNLSLSLGSGIVFENVIGGGLADTLTGNALANRLDGGGGNDTLNGGAGNDALTGGAGADRFRFDTPLNATTNRDVIRDFSIAQGDTIELENAVFTALTTAGPLAASAFFIGARANTKDQRILYNSANGNLLYDQDGSGAIGSICFATITSRLALNNTSFIVT